MSKLTVVVPAYNESEGLRDFHARLAAVLDALDLDGEVLYVDDGSRDDTYAVMTSLRAADARVSTLKLSRNFGKELALTAGLDYVDADAAIVIDADLQDPPELIPTFVRHWREGYDVVYGTRASRAGETGFKKLTSSGFYRVMEKLSATPIPRDTGDFRLLSRRALDALKQVRERQRFMKGLFTWVGFRQLSVVYHRDPRHAARRNGTTGDCGILQSMASLRFPARPSKSRPISACCLRWSPSCSVCGCSERRCGPAIRCAATRP